MRHIGSIVLGLVLAPVIYLLAGYGMVKMTRPLLVAHPDGLTSVGAVLAILAASALYALLILPRLSPLGPALAGLSFFVLSVWGQIAPHNLLDLLPRAVFGTPGIAYEPLPGGVLLLSVPLMLTILSPRRWRRYANRPAAVAPGYPPAMPAPHPQPAYPQPAYPQPAYPQPGYPQPIAAPPAPPLTPFVSGPGAAGGLPYVSPPVTSTPPTVTPLSTGADASTAATLPLPHDADATVPTGQPPVDPDATRRI